MKDRDEILGILLPDQGKQFLLPNVSIAEIIIPQESDFIPNTSYATLGIIGSISWRLGKIPLYHLSPLLDKSYSFASMSNLDRPRIAIINLVTKVGHPNYAILATDTPRLTRLKYPDIKNEEKMSETEAITFKCTLGNEIVMIPNLVHLEKITPANFSS